MLVPHQRVWILTVWSMGASFLSGTCVMTRHQRSSTSNSQLMLQAAGVCTPDEAHWRPTVRKTRLNNALIAGVCPPEVLGLPTIVTVTPGLHRPSPFLMHKIISKAYVCHSELTRIVPKLKKTWPSVVCGAKLDPSPSPSWPTAWTPAQTAAPLPQLCQFCHRESHVEWFALVHDPYVPLT